MASSSAAGSKPDFLPTGWAIDVDAFKRAALKKQLLSARAIAAAAGIAQESVARLYRNEPVGLKTLLALAKALGLTWPDDVLAKDEALTA